MKKLLLTAFLCCAFTGSAWAGEFEEQLATLKVYNYMKKHNLEEVDTPEKIVENPRAGYFYVCGLATENHVDMWNCLQLFEED